MKKKIFFLGLIFTVFLLWGQVVSVVFAEGDESLEDKLERLQNEAYEQQIIQEEAQEEVETISEQLRILQEDIDEASDEYNKVTDVLYDIEQQIEENQELLSDTEQDLEIKSRLLRYRIRDIYMHGRLSYLEVLLGSEDFSDFLMRVDILKRILKSDYDLLKAVFHERNIFMTVSAELERDKKEQEILVAEANKQLEILETRQEDKKILLEKVEYDRDTAAQVYQELMAASHEVEMLIRQKTEGGKSTPVAEGKMRWPLFGEITSEYGWRLHPIHEEYLFHSGIDIGGDYGMAICAAMDGQCIYSDWISGYGYTIILDHGNGLTTLYAHNDELILEEGEYIKQGELIALCGSTGNSTGPHCHFEVRVDGETVNPYEYL